MVEGVDCISAEYSYLSDEREDLNSIALVSPSHSDFESILDYGSTI